MWWALPLMLAQLGPTPPVSDPPPPVDAPAAHGSSASVLVVGPDAPWGTVTAAIRAAKPGDTVLVRSGLYREPTLVVDKPLTLLGEPGAILDGEGERGLVHVVADSVTVEGFTLRDTGLSFTDDRSAVLVERARFCTLRSLRLENSFFGLYLANAGDCLIEGNTLTSASDRETRSGNGIHLWYSTRVTIRDNRVRGHRDGIYFEFVEDSRVIDNVSEGNVRYGLHFMFSDGCDYRRNTFSHNGAGVAVMYTSDVVMGANDFRGNLGTAAFGLLLKDITDSEIVDNRFHGNSIGLHAEGANRVRVAGNDFVENGWAVRIMANSEASEVTANNFVGNSFDVATNSRRSYSDFTGNFWDRYRGYDRDGDGVGDVPYHPVRLFSLVVAQNEPALVLQRSPLVSLLDLAEQVLPVLTPESLADSAPLVSPVRTGWSSKR